MKHVSSFVGSLLLSMVLLGPALAQTVGIGTSTPAASAALDVTAPANDKGFLPPRLSEAQRNAIASPAAGLTIFNTDSKHLNVWDGTGWTAPISNTEAAYVPGAQTFGFTGGPQTYTVPRGVTSIVIDAVGASGMAGKANPFPPASKGARVVATLAVTPGEVLTVVVGGAASTPLINWYAGVGAPPAAVGGGGYNGGGNVKYTNIYSAPVPPPQSYWYQAEYHGGGGGATDVRRGGTALGHRVVVAAGGGGASLGAPGGDGGGLV
ncbi:glycine-rich protein, partial [Hymenobacter sp. ASUV-10]